MKKIDDVEVHEITPKQLEAEIKAFEAKYGYTSEELIEMYNEGIAPDTWEIHAWLALLDFWVK